MNFQTNIDTRYQNKFSEFFLILLLIITHFFIVERFNLIYKYKFISFIILQRDKYERFPFTNTNIDWTQLLFCESLASYSTNKHVLIK